MSDITVDVYLALDGDDRLVGRLHVQHHRGVQSATFLYDESWLSSATAFELEPGLPLVAGPQQTPVGRSLFGAFTDSAPDRWGQRLIMRNEQRRVVHAGGAPRTFGDIDFLLGVRDDVRGGALRFRTPDDDSFLADAHQGVPHLVDLGRLLGAADRLERESADDEDLRLLLHAGSSLGGARPKAHVLDVRGRLSIAKFPSPAADDWNVIAWEHVTLDLAKQSGLIVPASRLHQVAGTQVLLLDRFDRVGAQRIPYASAMTMLEAVDGERRSYLEIAEVIETISAQPVRDLQQLWRRIALSILVSNTDDHLRNHGFLRAAGESGWRLSPAFDINPNPHHRGQLSTAINDHNFAADIDALLSVADWYRLDRPGALRILAEVERATSSWRKAATRIGLSPAQITFMAPAFEHEQRQRACALSPSS